MTCEPGITCGHAFCSWTAALFEVVRFLVVEHVDMLLVDVCITSAHPSGTPLCEHLQQRPVECTYTCRRRQT